MSLKEIKATAFAKWLLSQSRAEAVAHLWECLATGPKPNMAWDLWKAVHGDKRIPPSQLETHLDKMLAALEAA